MEPGSKAAANRDPTSAPVPSSPEQIRNVVLVGPGGAGKSTLFDYLIAVRTPGRRPHEGEHERSVGVQVAAVESAGLTVNLIDTPGYPDFVGELRAGLAAASAAIFVVSAADGIDSATASLWRECEAVGMPRAVVVSKLDTERAEYEDTLAEILAIPGAGLQPTEADMERVGELCLHSTKAGAFTGQTVTFIGLNNANAHNNIFRPLSRAWEEYTGATIQWIDVPQAEIFAKVQQGVATGEVDFDLLEGGAPWEGDLLGRGLCSAMPDWVKEQIVIDDYVALLKAPVGTLSRAT